ncbi:hypothetical protein ACFSTC_09505 [Nonomuraea ferruginea]
MAADPLSQNATIALDLVITNAVVLDPILGVVKGDIGIKDGRIVGIGKAEQPAHPERRGPQAGHRRGHGGAGR